ncbi:hypothetical protein PG985_015135 [Apiospora marii]|uniref:Uncharacterized protein n=1 Tax=Apiospora marii TaxID=335849 RepID=A0ABR1RLW4_9PEZI
MSNHPHRLPLLVSANKWSAGDPEGQEELDDFRLIERVCEGQPYLTPEIMQEYRIAMDPFRKHNTNAVITLWNLATHAHPGDYRARTWGYTIVRTAYDDDRGANGAGSWDAKFQNALTAIRRAVQAPYEQELARIDEDIRPFIENPHNRWPADHPTKADRRAEDEVDRRFVNDVLEDPAVLADATVGQVSHHFRRWALARWRPKGPDGRPTLYQPLAFAKRRLKTCILLDAKTIEQLQGAGGAVGPAAADLYPRLGEFWVKMVEAEPQLRLDRSDVRGGGPPLCDCYRVRLTDLEHFWFATGTGDEDVAQKTREEDPGDNGIHYFNRDYEETLALADKSTFDWMRIESEPLPETRTVVLRDKRMAISSLLE